MSALRVLANHATVYPRYLLVMHALVHLKLSKVLGLIKKIIMHSGFIRQSWQRRVCPAVRNQKLATGVRHDMVYWGRCVINY
jgi:hypothetical protein